MDIFTFIFPIVFGIVGIALIWFVVELSLTVRYIRKTVKNDVNPALQNVNSTLEELQPVIKKVDPLVERVTLTVDSVNLELMRVDGILEEVGHITNGVSKTVNAVDTVTSAPLDIVTNVTNKVRSRLRPKYASNQSVSLGSERVPQKKENPLVDFVDVAGSAAASAASNAASTAANAVRREARHVRRTEDVAASISETKEA